MNEARLEARIKPILESRGLELDSIKVTPAGRRSVLRITVDGDGPLGRGPLLDDIASATREISDSLDESDVAPNGAYTLEVSSRGIDRPLTEAKHYRRNRTRLVKLTMTNGTTIVGRIIEVDDNTLQLEVTPESVKGNRNPKPVMHEIALDDIAKAMIQIEMNRPIDDWAEGAPEEDDTDEDDSDEDDSDDELVDDDNDDDAEASDEENGN